MSKKDLEIKCPDCGCRLRIDRESGKVIAHGGGEKPSDLAEVKARMEGNTQRKQDAFGAAGDLETRAESVPHERLRPVWGVQLLLHGLQCAGMSEMTQPGEIDS